MTVVTAASYKFVVLGIDGLEVSRDLQDGFAQVDQQLRLADVLGFTEVVVVGAVAAAPQQRRDERARATQLTLVQLLHHEHISDVTQQGILKS